MDGLRGYRGWRWIFILGTDYAAVSVSDNPNRLRMLTEGTLTCVMAVILFFLISDFPEEASWLSPDEKEFVRARLEDDVGQSGSEHSFRLADVITLLKDCT